MTIRSNAEHEKIISTAIALHLFKRIRTPNLAAPSSILFRVLSHSFIRSVSAKKIGGFFIHISHPTHKKTIDTAIAVPIVLLWGGRWDSNPRSSVPQTDALGQLRYTHHIGAPEGTRTPGPLLRRQVLYPAELQALVCPIGRSIWSG